MESINRDRYFSVWFVNQLKRSYKNFKPLAFNNFCNVSIKKIACLLILFPLAFNNFCNVSIKQKQAKEIKIFNLLVLCIYLMVTGRFRQLFGTTYIPLRNLFDY